MKKKYVFLSLGLALALAGTVRAGQRPLSVCINGSEGDLLDSKGELLQTLEFDNGGQSVAGPLSPGQYTVRTTLGDVDFTLCTNASLCQVEGPGWTDGEQLHLGLGTGRLTVLYDGAWSCTLAGETAAEAIPSLSDGRCVFDALPLGWYVLHAPIGRIPVLLTQEEPELAIDLRE